MIIIQSATIVFEVSRIIRCECSTIARTPLGDSQIVNRIEFSESHYLPQPDWTDEDLKGAVATFLNVPSADVSIANEA